MALRKPRIPRSASYQISRPIPKKNSCSVTMLADNNNSQVNRRITLLQIKSTFRDQVFENHSEGIVCYESESGELICEGYDEGPRFQTTPSIVSTFHSRDGEIIELLQKNWVRLGDASCSLYKLDKGVALLQEDFYLPLSGHIT